MTLYDCIIDLLCAYIFLYTSDAQREEAFSLATVTTPQNASH